MFGWRNLRWLISVYKLADIHQNLDWDRFFWPFKSAKNHFWWILNPLQLLNSYSLIGHFYWQHINIYILLQEIKKIWGTGIPQPDMTWPSHFTYIYTRYWISFLKPSLPMEWELVKESPPRTGIGHLQ